MLIKPRNGTDRKANVKWNLNGGKHTHFVGRRKGIHGKLEFKNRALKFLEVILLTFNQPNERF